MRRLNEKVETTTCPDCGERALKTDWMPPDGYDPTLRQFRCTKCELEIYIATTPEISKTLGLVL